MIEPQGQTPHIKFSRANLENSKKYGNAPPSQSGQKQPHTSPPLLQNKSTFFAKILRIVRKLYISIYK
jgi:hypothetical protein